MLTNMWPITHRADNNQSLTSPKPGSSSASGNNSILLHYQQAMLPSKWISGVQGLNRGQIPGQASPLPLSENNRCSPHRPQAALSPPSVLPIMGFSPIPIDIRPNNRCGKKIKSRFVQISSIRLKNICRVK